MFSKFRLLWHSGHPRSNGYNKLCPIGLGCDTCWNHLCSGNDPQYFPNHTFRNTRRRRNVQHFRLRDPAHLERHHREQDQPRNPSSAHPQPNQAESGGRVGSRKNRIRELLKKQDQ